ncbi:gap junction delta-4 protein [Tupaia chinensis]|uniref:gap junction delta-4 protein n=1 Tax=Tupaia chinensis TaxID=246437 RepID=UPI0003C8F5FC|nr:gap junction delta-4 protein [Tupaia chinensis]
MERPDSLGLLIVTLNCNVTIMGKVWLVVTVLLRMAVVVLAGYPVYQDEQEQFVCNTLQPGCANVCYDLFSPVSPLRFWLVQGLSVLLPYAVFSVYVLHKGATLAARRLCDSDGGPGGHHPDLGPGDRTCPRPCRERRPLMVPDFCSGYIAHLCLRTLVEAALGASHYFLFGFQVPKTFSCTQAPCSSVVDCYVSRPTEKSILMLFLWAVSGHSFFLGVADLVCSLRRRARRRPGRQRGARSPSTQKECPALLSAGHEGGGSGVEGVHTHPGMRAGEEGAHSPGRESIVSRWTELPDEEDESQGKSATSERPPTACRGPSRDARSKDLGLEEQASALQSRLTMHSTAGQLQPPGWPATGSTSHLRTKKSQWV